MAETRELQLLLTLKDEISKQMEKVGDALKDVQKQMKPAVDASKEFALGLAAVGTAAVGFGVMTVKAASEAQVKLASLDAVLNTMGKSSEGVRDKILKAASATVQLGFDDEEAAVSIGKLYQRTGDLNQAINLNSIAMDLARSKHLDLTTASNMVGLVLSGNARILKQYGIDIKDTASPMEALIDLQKRLAGQAQNFSNTFEGQMQVLRQEWENFMETIGDKLLPVVTQFLQKVNGFVVNELPQWIERTKEIIRWMQEHKNIMALVVGGIVGALIPAFVSFAITLTTVTIPAVLASIAALSPYILGGMVVAGIVAGIVWVIKNWDDLIAKVKELPVIGEIFKTIQIAFNEVWQIIQTYLWPAFQNLWSVIKTQLWPALQDLWQAMQPFAPLFQMWLKVMGTLVGAGILLMVQALTGLAAILSLVLTAITDLVTFITKIASGVIKSIADDVRALASAFQSAVDWISKLIDKWNQYRASGASLNPMSPSFKLPGFAEGGIVTRPTLAMVGEGGEPEAIIPFSKMAGLGGGSVTINISGNMLLDRDAGDFLANQIMNRLRLNQKLSI